MKRAQSLVLRLGGYLCVSLVALESVFEDATVEKVDFRQLFVDLLQHFLLLILRYELGCDSNDPAHLLVNLVKPHILVQVRYPLFQAGLVGRNLVANAVALVLGGVWIHDDRLELLYTLGGLLAVVGEVLNLSSALLTRLGLLIVRFYLNQLHLILLCVLHLLCVPHGQDRLVHADLGHLAGAICIGTTLVFALRREPRCGRAIIRADVNVVDYWLLNSGLAIF